MFLKINEMDPQYPVETTEQGDVNSRWCRWRAHVQYLHANAKFVVEKRVRTYVS